MALFTSEDREGDALTWILTLLLPGTGTALPKGGVEDTLDAPANAKWGTSLLCPEFVLVFSVLLSFLPNRRANILAISCSCLRAESSSPTHPNHDNFCLFYNMERGAREGGGGRGW